MNTDIQKWEKLAAWFQDEFKMEADVDAMLFMIGVQELGKGFENFGKTQKLELIHIGICTVLQKDGYYKFTHLDQEGWPHYVAEKKLPYIKGQQQKEFMKKYLLEYFYAFIKD
jgi:hypothetical protein